MNRATRSLHLATALVASAAVVLQFVLVLQGHAVLDETDPPSLGTRVVRFFSYFTILSNLLVAGSAWDLVLRGSGTSSRLRRVLRTNALVGISVTALVHWVALRPLLDLQGIDALADGLLHVAVPLLAVVTWALAGPRGWIRGEELPATAVYPVVYLAWTLLHGALTHWYPYPFIDVAELGYARVLLNAVVVVVLLVALSAGAWWLDRRLPGEVEADALT